jgi:NADH:ubiquinone oxidoreductase subunit
MGLGTRLFTWFSGSFVGEDSLGNRYFRERGQPSRGLGRERRWVIYRGEPEASSVPPGWHAWLHHQSGEPPKSGERHAWQREHAPNLTGTPMAYRPPGHVLQGGKRARATGDYEPWTPD